MMVELKFAYECWKDVLVVDVGALVCHVRCSVVQMQVQFRSSSPGDRWLAVRILGPWLNIV